MKIISVEKEKCINCKKCVIVCGPRLFFIENDNIVNYLDPYDSCNKCGHCLAVCPNDAISFESSTDMDKMPKTIPDIQSTLNLLLSKRSLRNYKNKIVQKSDIQSIIKAMTYAPSGGNTQACDFIVITNKELKKVLIEATVKALKFMNVLMKVHWILKPFVSELMYKVISSKKAGVGLNGMLKDIKSGDDRIFFNAPVIIVGHIPASGDIALVDSAVAFTYGMIAGHAMGIGSCWMGFTMMAVKKNRKIHEMLKIPKRRIIAGVITLGYPSIEYFKVPIRNDRNIVWLD
jgi:nitroreductase/Pyruvate/2-oxoacid:ferredoxin oxidoreductase delta subunit